MLDGIGRTSLPGLLATLNPDGTTTPGAQLPPSTCTGVSIAKGGKDGGKLILDGRLAVRRFETVAEPESIDYTLRMGLRAGQAGADGNVVQDEFGQRDLPLQPGLRSVLLWDAPELKLSLGDGPLARLLPQLWVPVLSASGVVLPPAVELLRSTVSEPGDGVSVAGTLRLGGGEPPESFGLTVR